MHLKLAQLAKTIYLPRYEFIAEARKIGFNNNKWIESDIYDTQAAVVSDGMVSVFVCRGTEVKSIQDISTDLNVVHKKITFGNVHAGFYAAMMSIYIQSLSALKEAGCPVWFTGHSLGGAVASLMAVLSNPESIHKQGLVTFGSPAIGDQKFSQYAFTQIHHARYIYKDDPVPKVPPSWRFWHFGDVNWFAKDGDLRLKMPWYKKLLSTSDVSDHGIENYVHAIMMMRELS